MPKINQIDSILINIYNQSSGARDGMSGTLNFSVLLDVAKSQGLTDFEDLLFLANEMESNLMKKRDEKSKNNKG